MVEAAQKSASKLRNPRREPAAYRAERKRAGIKGGASKQPQTGTEDAQQSRKSASGDRGQPGAGRRRIWAGNSRSRNSHVPKVPPQWEWNRRDNHRQIVVLFQVGT